MPACFVIIPGGGAMKRSATFILALALLISLFTAVSGSVLAVEKDISAVVGSEVSLEIDLGTQVAPTGVSTADGQLPPGLELSVSEGKLLLAGTPTQAGDFRAVIKVEPSSGEEHTLRIRIEEAAQTGENGSDEPDNGEETPAAPVGPEITKHPGNEYRSAMSTALFVSRANGASEITWYLISPQGVTYLAEDTESLFSGLAVVGQGTETLALYCLPTELSGWEAECHFKNTAGGESVSDRATVTVDQTTPSAPVVTQWLEDTFILLGEQKTLTIYAEAPAGNSINYQWYQTTELDPATVIAIQDATSADFTPPETEGTVYYCAGLRSVNGETVSTIAYTPLIAVTYGSEPPVPEHIHDFGTEWQFDDVYHWQVCECGETSGYLTHTYSWTETVKPTARKPGERVGVCTACGFETTQTVPAQRQESTGRPKMTTLIALLMIVIAMLLFGVYYYVRVFGGQRPVRRGTSQTDGGPADGPGQTEPWPQENGGQWQGGTQPRPEDAARWGEPRLQEEPQRQDNDDLWRE